MGLRYRALGWETQQLWLAAHATLAADYAAKGDREKAKQTLGLLLDLWKDADPDLPLLKQAKVRIRQAAIAARQQMHLLVIQNLRLSAW